VAEDLVAVYSAEVMVALAGASAAAPAVTVEA